MRPEFGRGSPPRRRGRRPIKNPATIRTTLTPAQAGTAKWTALRMAKLRAHPRAGGDGAAVLVLPTASPGSPPRRRGRPEPSESSSRAGGLTPAQAGTAGTVAVVDPRRRAHPRAGGDGSLRSAQFGDQWGSPPRRRGRQDNADSNQDGIGLTPAQAGTAASRLCSSSFRRAHPRAGGDGVQLSEAEHLDVGSPPRRRGRHLA